jgi:hypothetical protein
MATEYIKDRLGLLSTPIDTLANVLAVESPSPNGLKGATSLSLANPTSSRHAMWLLHVELGIEMSMLSGFMRLYGKIVGDLRTRGYAHFAALSLANLATRLDIESSNESELVSGKRGERLCELVEGATYIAATLNIYVRRWLLLNGAVPSRLTRRATLVEITRTQELERLFKTRPDKLSAAVGNDICV